MDRDILENDVNQNLSTRKIAEKNGVSQGTVKHWLKKYNLKTNHLIGSKKTYGDHKFCPKCNTTLPINEYYNKSTKESTKINGHGWCKNCTNKATVERQRQLKQKCIDYKGGKCFICGYNTYAGALEFHHLNPKDKDYAISRFKNRKFESIVGELDKCVLLCSNCHKEVEGGVKEVGPVGLEPTTF
jgi:hypothetical protein